jgi:hypothetical protein
MPLGAVTSLLGPVTEALKALCIGRVGWNGERTFPAFERPSPPDGPRDARPTPRPHGLCFASG